MTAPTDTPRAPSSPACDPFDQDLPRDVTLRLLSGRFSSENYKLYRTTAHWQERRAAAYAVWGYECLLCGAPGSQVHHTREGYRHLFREDARRHLRPLCRECHRRFHRR